MQNYLDEKEGEKRNTASLGRDLFHRRHFGLRNTLDLGSDDSDLEELGQKSSDEDSDEKLKNQTQAFFNNQNPFGSRPFQSNQKYTRIAYRGFSGT